MSGVPRSTIYYWAREELYVPSISHVKEKRWSFADLLALRAIYWLRHEKPEASAARTTMRQVVQSLQEAREIGIPFGLLNIFVDVNGGIFYRRPESDELYAPGRQVAVKDVLDHVNLLTEFRMERGVAPDLREPRPHLRLIPGKLAGEPHVQDTRIQTLHIHVLRAKGMTKQTITSLYPSLSRQPVAIDEAVSLERQLEANLHQAA